MITIGLDVHQGSTTIALLDADTGELVGKPWSVPTRQLGSELSSVPEPCVAVIEAGSVSHFVTGQLQSLGIGTVTVDAAKASRRSEGMHGAKTDRYDAIALATLFAWGQLGDAVVWEPDEKTYELRAMTRARQKLNTLNVMARGMVRQLIARYATSCPATDLLGQAAGEWLDEFAGELSEDIAEIFGAYRELLTFIKGLMARLEARIAGATEEREAVERLRTIPGIGKTLAPTIIAEIGDIHRFASAERLRGYSGLAPRVKQSGQRTVIGKLTRKGNRHLRRAMIQAAELFKQSRATHGLRINRWYYGQLRRHGPNPARVALARKLLTIIYAMLRDGVDFDPTRYALDRGD
jgi:transposase